MGVEEQVVSDAETQDTNAYYGAIELHETSKAAPPGAGQDALPEASLLEDEGESAADAMAREEAKFYAMHRHKFGKACMKKAELIESDIGIFDDPAMGADKALNIAKRMNEVAIALLGLSKEDFERRFHRTLQG